MRNLFLATLLAAATVAAASPSLAQVGTTEGANVPNMGRAPKQPDGVGRLDLRVVDEQGNPVEGVRADLQSRRTNGFLCESWNFTNALGSAYLLLLVVVAAVTIPLMVLTKAGS